MLRVSPGDLVRLKPGRLGTAVWANDRWAGDVNSWNFGMALALERTPDFSNTKSPSENCFMLIWWNNGVIGWVYGEFIVAVQNHQR